MTHEHLPEQRPLAPLLGLDLSDGDRAVGWIHGRTIGFRGFANESDAGIAAWVAHGTVTRRLARRTDADPILVDLEPLEFVRLDGREVILASEEEIGTLLRPGAESRSGSDSFGFEIEIPAPADELRLRSMAHLIYRTLRRSGVRWSAPVPDVKQAKPSTNLARKHRADSPSTRGGVAMYNPNSNRRLGTHAPVPVNASLPPASSPSATTFVAGFLLISMAIVAAIALIVTAPLRVTVPLASVFFAYLFGTLVLSAGRRLRRRRDRRGHGPRGMGRPRGTNAPPREPDTDRIPSGVGALAAFSIGLLGVTVIAPEQLRVGLAAIGVAGLFVVRVFAMFGGWAPRGSAWAEPRPVALN